MLPLHTRPVGGTTLHYLDQGSGDPVLLLHGVNCGAVVWSDMVERLSTRFRAVAPDLPGWGDTPPPRGFRYDIGQLAEYMLDAMDKLQIPRAALVGWSFGGCLALHMAVRAPERVTRLVVAAPGGLSPEVHWSYKLMAVPGFGEWSMRATPDNIRAGLTFLTRDIACVPQEFSHHILQSARQPWFRRTTLQWVRRNRVFWEGARRISIADRLHEIRCPTLVLWGEEDPLVPPSQAAITAAIPGARVVMVPQTRHIIHYEQPDLFYNLLTEFLA